MTELPAGDCLFGDIVTGHEAASVIAADDFVMAVLDVRQYHPGHVLVIPRQHIADIRGVDISRPLRQ